MDNLLEALATLPDIGNYTANDRFHDFRKTFGTVEGQRVLRYILERGGVFSEPPLASPVDSHLLAAHRGKRQTALEIFSFYTNEPPPQPEKQTSKKSRSQL